MTTTRLPPRSAAVGILPLCIQQEQRLAREELAIRRGHRLPPSNLVSAACLRGPLDPALLALALERLVERHTALRASVRPSHAMPSTIRELQLQTFARTGVCDPGLYEQSIFPTPSVNPSLCHFHWSPAGFSDAGLTDLINHEASAPFELIAAPMMRARLLHKRPLEHVLLLTVSHLVCDPWALPMMWRDLLHLYKFRNTVPDSDPPPQYHEFTTWQTSQQYTGYFHRAINYWKRRWAGLQDCPSSESDLVWAQPTNPTLNDVSAVEMLDVDGSLADGIHRVSHACHVTPEAVFLAAFARLLRDAFRRPCVRFWMACPNRPSSNSQQTVGWLSNLHMLEVDVAACLHSSDLLVYCDAILRETYSHQELPLPMLWSELGRNLSGAVPSVVFHWQEHSPVADASGLTVHSIAPSGRRSPLPLGLYCRTVQSGQDFRTSVIYSVRLFPASTIRQAIAGFQRLLREIVRDGGL